MNQIALELQPADPSYRLIPLTLGKFAKVDPEDYDWLMQWKWVAHWDSKGRCFYAVRTAYNPKRSIRMHREIMKAEKGIEVDHRNHDTLDNRKAELRACTHSQNGCNRRMQSNNTSGHAGIIFRPDSRKWRARIKIKGKQKSLGSFATFDEAVAARTAASVLEHGEFRFRESHEQ